MTNEQIVSEIRNGYSVSENMQLLYESNLPLIKKIIKPYASYEPMEDILQESYFGLWEATKHYETSENVLFMTYARFWIVQAVQRYLEKCGSVLRIPSHTRQKITQCRRAIQRLEQEQGAEPTNEEIASCMGLTVKQVQEIKVLAEGAASTDTPIADDDSLTLSDTLQADSDIENETIDRMYDEYAKGELWAVVERYTSDRENAIIKEIFINNQNISQAARKQGITREAARQIKEKGLRKLRMGRARRELLQRFEVVDSALYRGGLNKYKEHNFVSIVEHTAIARIEAGERYQRHLKEIEEMQRKRLVRNP